MSSSIVEDCGEVSESDGVVKVDVGYKAELILLESKIETVRMFDVWMDSVTRGMRAPLMSLMNHP